MADADRSKTLTELEGQDLEPSTFASHLVATVHRLRHKPLEQFSVEDLRIAIGQNIGLEYLVPIAIEFLQENPFAEGDYYRGDLLVSVLKIERHFWMKHPELHQMVVQIVDQASARRQLIEQAESDALNEGIRQFHHAEA